MAWLIGVALAGAVAAALYHACSVPSSQILGPTLVRRDAVGNRVALTFDDAPAHPFTAQILDILRNPRVGAAFFVCGKSVERFPDLFQRMRVENHVIGNHTYSHPLLYLKTRSRMAEEIDRTQAAIEGAAGVRPRIFRSPHGVRWFGLFDVLAERGLSAVQRSVASFDWQKKGCPAALARLRPGSVILMHDGREPRSPDQVDAAVTVAALPAIIEGARKAGLEFVSVDEFLA